LDILVSIRSFASGHEVVPALAKLGYQYRPEDAIPDRHYFSRKNASAATHHLSLAEPTSQYLRDILEFRDALRNDPNLARAYANLKRQLCITFPTNRVAYLDGKSEFIHAVLNASRTREGAT
jgi:GrpB-like predicted nucleotidyltransferase (UPF0157 family)